MPKYFNLPKKTTSKGKLNKSRPTTTYKAKTTISEAQKERRAADAARRRAASQASALAAQAAKRQSALASQAQVQRDLFAEREKTSFVPTQVQAEVGDDFGKMAERLGVPEEAFIKANELDTTVKAGAVYNVPEQPLSAVTGSQDYQQPHLGSKALASPAQAEDDPWWYSITPWDEDETNFHDWAMSLPGPTQAAHDWINWGKNKDEESYLPGATKVMGSPAQRPISHPGGAGDYGFGSVGGSFDQGFGGTSGSFDQFGGDAGVYPEQIWGTGQGMGTPGSQLFPETSTLAQGLAVQLPGLYGAVGFHDNILALDTLDEQGRSEAIEMVGNRAFTKESTAEWLSQFSADGNPVIIVDGEFEGDIDWEAALAQDPNLLNMLEQLGYYSPGSGSGSYASGGTGGRTSWSNPPPMPSSYFGGGGSKPSYSRNPAYLSLTSWSI